MRVDAGLPIVRFVFVSMLVVTSGCVHIPERSPLPERYVEDAQPLGIPRARFWGDAPPPWEHQWLDTSASELKARYSGIYAREHTYLAISGGGQDGAFAAGLLLGWTESGNRPQFTTVTGISAGALVAPFAFLGPEYDEVLKEVSAELTADDVYEKRRTIRGLRSDAMASTKPLQALIEKHVDQEMMERIAQEYRKGRMLNIGTANLDAMRPVVWRIGAIANSGHPQALELIRRVLLASASIPGAFPPVLIQVEVGDERFDELHVDGGATSQVFLYPAGFNWDAVLGRLDVRHRPNVYIIRNSRIEPVYEQVQNKLFPIARRSIASLVRTQGIGDLYRIYLQTCRDRLVYNLAYIPSDFDETPEGPFDRDYMEKLFEMAFERARSGFRWENMPPELKTAPIDCR